jgi:hypothetical protein
MLVSTGDEHETRCPPTACRGLIAGGKQVCYICGRLSVEVQLQGVVYIVVNIQQQMVVVQSFHQNMSLLDGCYGL